MSVRIYGVCPSCGTANDASEDMVGDRPAGPMDGDVSICWTCLEPGIFVVTALGASVRKCSINERTAITGDGVYQQMAALARGIKASEPTEGER